MAITALLRVLTLAPYSLCFRSFTYGSLIYVLMGKKSEAAFARSWGISYGLNCATEWRGIIVEAAKGAFVLAILERLCLTRAQPWLECVPVMDIAACLRLC